MMANEADAISVEAAVPAAKCQSPQATRLPLQDRSGGFTLAELAVSMGGLVLLVLLFTQFLNSAATVTVLGYKKMDADSQARQVFDRMAFDFAQMVKRSDVDYYLKAPTNASDCGACGPQAGNDQMAFYSTVPGYYSIPTPTPVGSPTAASPFSLVSYRINSDSGPPLSSSYNKMERMSKALAWNGVFPSSSPNSSLTPVVYLPQTIGVNWPSAVSPSIEDPYGNYEIVGPQVFRFEYYYLLKNGQLSSSPWLVCNPSSGPCVRGLQDVFAIIVDIAVIDPKSKVLLTDSQIVSLAGQFGDYSSGMAPGQLLANWSAARDANIYPNGLGLSAQALSGIRVYERYFYLTH